MGRKPALVLWVSFAAFSSRVAAQERVAVPAPPPPQWVRYGPSAAEVDALEAGGRHQKRIGAILMGVGGGLALVGAGLAVGGAWHDDDSRCYGSSRYRRYRSYDSYYDNCGTSALSIAGITTTVVGIAALVPGILVFVDGAGDVDAARRARRCYGVGLHPWLGPSGAGMRLELTR